MNASRRLWASALLLTVLGTGFLSRVVVPRLSRPENVADLRAEVAAALDGFRLSEGRLVGFRHIHLQSVASRSPAVLAELRKLRNRIHKLDDQESLALIAVLDLAEGSPKRAIAKLEKAAEISPRNSKFLADLSASYLSLGVEEQDPYFLFLALQAADKATRLDPRLKEAHFNRAIALERLFVRAQAVTAWRVLSDLEQEPGWLEEVNAHIVALSQPGSMEAWGQERGVLADALLRRDHDKIQRIVMRSAQHVREWAEGEVLGAWSEAVLRERHDKAAENLATLRVVGSALDSLCGDSMLADAVSLIDRSLLGRDAEEVVRLARGHSLYWKALKQDVRANPGPTVTTFKEAEELLQQSSSPYWLWAKFGSALGSYHSARYSQALLELEAVDASGSTGYPVLQGRVAWIRGLISSDQGRFDLSLLEFRRSRSLFGASRQTAYYGAVSRLLADDLFTLGREQEAWAHLYEGLRTTSANLDPVRTLAAFEQAALAARKAGEPKVAIYFQNEGLAAVNQGRAQPAVAGSYALRAELHSEVGDHHAALADIQMARGLVGEISEEAVRMNMDADVSRVEGNILRSVDPPLSVKKLTQALRIYHRTGYRFYLAPAYFSRALAYIEMGDDASAEADLQAGIDEVERQRRPLDEQLKISFFDQAEPLFEYMLGVRLRRDDLDGAFTIAELSRARVLADLTNRSRGDVRPVSLSEVSSALPKGAAIVEYVLYGSKLVAFVVKNQGESVVELPINRRMLEYGIQRLWAARVDVDNWSRVSGALYKALVEPVEAQLQGLGTVYFIPHGILGRVPFSALVNPRTNVYLIEEMAVAVAPSATILLNAFAISGSRLRAGERGMMIFGNPGPNIEEAGKLPALPYAAEEINRLAALLPTADVVSGAEATRNRFFEGREYRIFHFIGHAVSNIEFPLLSRFIVTPDAGSGRHGAVFSHELYRRGAWKANLVTLAACGTASGRLSRSEGLEGLVRPFLAAGVPAVIGNLWDTRDQVTSEFFAEFYREAVVQADSLEALRQAQIHFIYHEDRRLQLPDVWAGYMHYGPGARMLWDDLVSRQ